MSTAFSGTATRGIDPEIIEHHFSDHATAACTLVARTATGIPFEITLLERTAAEATSRQGGARAIPNARRGFAERGNTRYTGLIHFDLTQNALTVHDPGTGYIVLQSTPIDVVTESQ